MLLLGAPLIGRGIWEERLIGHSDTLKQAVTDLACLRAQAALILLQTRFGTTNFIYLLRSSAYKSDGAGTRRLIKTKSVGRGEDPESQTGRQSDGYSGWCLELRQRWAWEEDESG